MMVTYDPGYVQDFYDRYHEREWARHEVDAPSRVSFFLHTWYLQQYIRRGDHVLEAGAGPGRFTVELAKLGARITVGDISAAQLALNHTKVVEAGYESAVLERTQLDILNLSRFPDQHFDAVVCYGGPISYVMDRGSEAVGELLRVIKPGGYFLLSVMSLLGSTRAALPQVLGLIPEHGVGAVQGVITTGDLPEALAGGHRCHMYRWTELKKLLKPHPCTLVAASAANFLSNRKGEQLEQVVEDPALWQEFLRWEFHFCRQSGAIDAGTHIIVVVQRA